MNMKKSIAAVSAGAMAISAMATVASANVNVHPMNENATSAREQVVLTYDLAQYVKKFKPTQVRTVTTYQGDEYFINGLDIDAEYQKAGADGVKRPASSNGIVGAELGSYTVILGGKLNYAPAAYYLQTVELNAKSMDHGSPSANGDQITGVKQHRQVWYSRATLGKDISDMQNDAVCVEDNLETIAVLNGKSGAKKDNNTWKTEYFDNCEYGFAVDFTTAKSSNHGEFLLGDFKASVNYNKGAVVGHNAEAAKYDKDTHDETVKYHTYDFDNAFRVVHGRTSATSLSATDSEGRKVNLIGEFGDKDLPYGKFTAEEYEIVATINWDNVNVEYVKDEERAYSAELYFITINEKQDELDVNLLTEDGELNDLAKKLRLDGKKITLKDLEEETDFWYPLVEEDEDNDVEGQEAGLKGGLKVYWVNGAWELDEDYVAKVRKDSYYSDWLELDAGVDSTELKIIDRAKVGDYLKDEPLNYDEESDYAKAVEEGKELFSDDAEYFGICVKNQEALEGKWVLVPKYTSYPASDTEHTRVDPARGMFSYFIVRTEEKPYTETAGKPYIPTNAYDWLVKNSAGTESTPLTGYKVSDLFKDANGEYPAARYTTYVNEYGLEVDWESIIQDPKHGNGKDVILTIGDLVGAPGSSDLNHVYYQGNGYEFANYHFGVQNKRDNWDVPVVLNTAVKLATPTVHIAKEIDNEIDDSNSAGKAVEALHYSPVLEEKVVKGDLISEATEKVDAVEGDYRQKYSFQQYVVTCTYTVNISDWDDAKNYTGSQGEVAGTNKYTPLHNGIRVMDTAAQLEALEVDRKTMEAILLASESNRAYVIDDEFSDLITPDTVKTQQGYLGSTAVSVVTGANYYGVKPMRSALNTPADVIWWLNQEKDGGKKYTSPVTVLNDVIGNNEEVSFRFISSKKRVRNTNALEVKGWRNHGDGTYTVSIKNPFTGETEVRIISGFTPGDKTSLLPEFNGFTTNDGDPTISWYSPTFEQHLYGNPTYTTDNNHSLSTNGTGYPLSGTTTDGADNTGLVNPFNWGEGIGNYGSYNYGGWQTNLFNGGLVINSNWTMQINDTKHFDWGDDSIIFFWNDLTADVKTHASNFLVSMLLYTPTEWFWDTLEVGVGAAAAENVAKVDTGAGQDNDAAEVVEDEEIVEEETFEEEPEDYEEPEEDYFDEFEEEPEDEEYEDYEEYEEYEEPEDYEEEEEEPEEEEEETVVVVQEVPSPKTGNSPIALAVIPVALAAAAIVAKKKND